MPNYVHNILRIEDGFDQLDIFTDNDFDFNKIIPMPKELNITKGSVNYYGMYLLWKETKENIKKGIDTTKNAILLNEIEEVFNEGHSSTGSIADMESRINGWHDTKEEEEKALNNGRAYVNNYIKYGYPTWYEWCLANWDTKWNAMDTRIIEVENEIYFTTAWSPPINVIKELSKLVQGKKVYLNYEGEIDPYGKLEFLNGEIVKEEYYMEDYDCDYDEDEEY